MALMASAGAASNCASFIQWRKPPISAREKLAIMPWLAASHRQAGSVKNLGRYAASWIAWWPNRPSSRAALT